MHNNFKYLFIPRLHWLGHCGPSETNYGPACHTAGTAIFQTLCVGGGGLAHKDRARLPPPGVWAPKCKLCAPLLLSQCLLPCCTPLRGLQRSSWDGCHLGAKDSRAGWGLAFGMELTRLQH